MTKPAAGYATENTNPVAYPGTMTDSHDTHTAALRAFADELEQHREALRAIAAEQDKARTLPERRTKAVAAAREAGMTWREASVILGMTTEGLRKAARPSPGK